MSQTTVTFKMDTKLKEEAGKLFNELGLSLSAALTIFLKTAVREQRIPFALTLYNPNKETEAAIKDIEENNNIHSPFNSIEELVESLNAED